MLQNSHPGGLNLLGCRDSSFSIGLHYPVANLKLPLGILNAHALCYRKRQVGRKGGRQERREGGRRREGGGQYIGLNLKIL